MSATSIRLRTRTTALGLQRGVAAIEFAFVFVFLFLVMYGLVTFGAIFYTQQAVSRAAEDGARAAMLLPQPPDQESVRQVVFDSLARSLVVPISFNADMASRKTWLSTNVTVTPCSATPGATSCVVTVTYLYKNNRILPSVSLLDTSWVPDNLRSSATAALRPS
ncbi:TadE-like protein [Variovorax paradoxus B4]|uniref:TadE-like protein n=1 Tax=Variovorax paradoxus B4 TaxID=1246301 RepID=T1XGQ8_VARPD|nr:TadE/TadG family type IV pilus assembly protein [Variovorax paradoxus]AGU51696.1 TadE-like protein [Variovorax paradoxus B4]